MRMRRFCRPVGAGMVLLFALTVGLAGGGLRFRKEHSLSSGGEELVFVPPELLGGDGSPEIDALSEQDPQAFHTVMRGGKSRLEHEDTREYLNRLVEASSLDAGNQVSNLAFFKTHKTGSTTLAVLLHRYGRRHNLQVAHFPGYGSTIPIAEAANKTRETRNRLDIMHYHIDTDTARQERWAQAKARYGDVMRDPDNINFITLFREPRDRLLSFYTFFVEFETRVPIEVFFRQENPDPKVVERLRNLGCKEFGVETAADLDDFIRTEIPQFKLILLSERFDEGLMVLRNLLGWHLVDMTYISVNRTAGREGREGVVLKDRSPFDKLPQDVQDRIDELTVLDGRLYDAGVAAFEKKRAAIAGQVEEDMGDFEKLQIVMNEHLRHNPSDPVLDLYRYKTAKYYEEPPPMVNF